MGMKDQFEEKKRQMQERAKQKMGSGDKGDERSRQEGGKDEMKERARRGMDEMKERGQEKDPHSER